MKEIWKDIQGFEGIYQISNKARVKSLARKYVPKERILTNSMNGNGYQKVHLMKDGSHHKKYIHRLVAKAFIPNPDNKPDINHKDGIKDNNFPYNLEWCTPKENHRHAFDNGFRDMSWADNIKGNNHGMSKLRECDVREIRKHAEEKGKNYGRKDLSKKYNVSESTINRVVNNVIWQHV